MFIGASILTILELFDYIYEVRFGVNLGGNNKMVEHPDSEPSMAEAIASFHPHKDTSPKHKAGVLKRSGWERNGRPLPLFGPVLHHKEGVEG